MRMLIDARHQEETRVAVLNGNRIEEFDFESAEHKQIKGNIYLAKVTRVEPSLQAAFVDFGGNRHGFLAFSEIHPDYYQIPKEDREALLAEEAAHAEEEAALRAAEDGEDDFGESALDRIGDHDHSEDMGAGLGSVTEVDTDEFGQVATIEGGQVENGFDHDDDEITEDDEDAEEDRSGDSGDRPRRGRRQGRGRAREADELRAKRLALRRRYKIQDVIQRRQVLLVQVVKEERGNKGAALTTYLSLAGRYCVLMPNSSHGGGISRKISSAADRKRLKAIISELGLPRSMGCIVRTAGLSRTKTEIKRDFDYLARLWDEIRENTLKSSAPALIHSDSDLIKRAIRDIYNRDIEEVIVEGESGYRAARDFMKLLMPSHAKRVRQYADPVPLFQRYGAEDQLTAMYAPEVQLKSGGYIVINPTEAMVSIDINSGRSTKEHGIEATALKTNLEAAREIARQLRLRDMAGLVVIDFIDMEYSSNVRKVEKAMKEALKHDRARIQIGRISSFGLMEMSRQRLRTGVLEATTRSCPHCDGSGLVRTASSAGLSALRLIEDEAAKGRGTVITLFASTEAAVYLLNAKRADLSDIEVHYGVHVEVIPEGENEGAKMRVISSGPRNEFVPHFEPLAEEPVDDEAEDEPFDDNDETEETSESGENRPSKRRRSRRRRKPRDRAELQEGESEIEGAEPDEQGSDGEDGHEHGEDSADSPKKKRRRGRRRRKPREEAENQAGVDGSPETPSDQETDFTPPIDDDAAVQPEEAESPLVAEAKPKRTKRKKAADTAETDPGSGPESEAPAKAKPKRPRARKAAMPAAAGDEPVAAPETSDLAQAEAPADGDAPPKPARARTRKASAKSTSANQAAQAPPAPEPAHAVPADEDASGEPRRGWWQRTFGE